MTLYVCAREAVLWHRGLLDSQDLTVAQDAMVFATSILSLLAVMEPAILKAIVDFRPSLLILGFAGLRYCIRSPGRRP
jgi:hypothetical protein